MPTPAELLAQSLAKLRTANRIDGTRASYRKDNPGEYVSVMVYLDGGPRPGNVTSDMGMGLLLEEDARRALAPPPPPPPSGVSYPASYFTGPLGNRNPVPPKKGCFLGAELSMPGGAITWPQHIARVQQREADMGRKYDFLMIQDLQVVWPDNKLQWINDHGSIPVANYLDLGRNVTDVKNGLADATVNAFADHYAAMNFTVMLRLYHEFDAPAGYVWSAVGREADFVLAWKRIVDMFRTRGATNVGFWWCPNEGVNRAVINACYPGDTYVDWVGSDIYNFDSSGHSSPIHAGFAEFWELVDYNVSYGDNPGLVTQHERWGPRKPFVISETGSVVGLSGAAAKGQWYRNIPAAARNMEWLCGVAPFDVDWNGAGDTLVDHPVSVPAVYDGFKAMAADPYFNTRT